MGYGHAGLLWGVLGFIASVIGTIVLLAVIGGLIFLLVRFLLVATTAAKIYVAKNTPDAPVTPSEPVVPAATSTTTPATTVTPPTTKPRTPKTPPAV
jgi:predicted lipid-binding transport protein (Tim44 family)